VSHLQHSDYRIVIPARMASQRLPGKPLAMLAGKSLLEHVFHCAQRSAASSVVIATDDEKICAHARGFGASVLMTSPDHQSGSDRIAEVVASLDWPNESIVVNLQGDEPLMPAACLDQVAALLAADSTADMASLYWPIDNETEARDPNVVKAVVSNTGKALFFSRSLLPYPRGWGSVDEAISAGMRWYRHIGLYAYRAGALRRFSQLASTPLEQAEKLEQLRVLESGGSIVMALACEHIPAGIDTPEDLERVENIMIKNIR